MRSGKMQNRRNSELPGIKKFLTSLKKNGIKNQPVFSGLITGAALLGLLEKFLMLCQKEALEVCLTAVL